MKSRDHYFNWANPRLALDAAIASCLHSGSNWRRASDAGRSAIQSS
jgi:hypothetical protein